MGIWKEIKYALNSSVGTDLFESLDKIIITSKSLGASDNIYHVCKDATEVAIQSTEYEVEDFICKRDGTVRIRADVRKTSYYFEQFTLNVYRRTNSSWVLYASTVTDIGTSGNHVAICNMQIAKNERYKITCSANTSLYDVLLCEVNICADEMDLTGISVTNIIS